VPGSYPSRGENHLRTDGLITAIKVQADACKPSVLLKESIVKPRKKDDTRRIQPGVSNGKSNI